MLKKNALLAKITTLCHQIVGSLSLNHKSGLESSDIIVMIFIFILVFVFFRKTTTKLSVPYDVRYIYRNIDMNKLSEKNINNIALIFDIYKPHFPFGDERKIRRGYLVVDNMVWGSSYKKIC